MCMYICTYVIVCVFYILVPSTGSMAGQNRSQVGDLYESTVLIVKINEAKNIS